MIRGADFKTYLYLNNTQYIIYVTDNNIGACAGASIVVLSVKPQVLDNVINDLYN